MNIFTLRIATLLVLKVFPHDFHRASRVFKNFCKLGDFLSFGLLLKSSLSSNSSSSCSMLFSSGNKKNSFSSHRRLKLYFYNNISTFCY